MDLESIYLEAFIDHLLRNDAQLIAADALDGGYIYRDIAQQDAPFPNTTYNIQSAVDFQNVNKDQIFAEYIYQVVVWGEVKGGILQNPARIRKAVRRVVTVMDGVRAQPFTLDGVTFHFSIWRDGEVAERTVQGPTVDVMFKKYGVRFRCQAFN